MHFLTSVVSWTLALAISSASTVGPCVTGYREALGSQL
jgi:hypothetical protein